MSTLSTPLAARTASALEVTNAAEELRPPPAGTVPSIKTRMLFGCRSLLLLLNSSNAPLRPALK